MNSSEALKKIWEYSNEVDVRDLTKEELAKYRIIGNEILYETEREIYKRGNKGNTFPSHRNSVYT